MTMISNPSHLPNRDIILDRISDGGNGHGNMVMNWTSDTVESNPHVSRRRHHARQAQARLPDGRERLDADRLLRPGLPDLVEGRRPERRSRSARLLPLQRPAGRRVRRADVLARTAARSPTTTVTASTSRPSRPSPPTARSTARRPTPPLVIPGGRRARLGPRRRPARRARPAGRPAPPTDTGTKPNARSRCRSRSSPRPARGGVKVSVKVAGQGQALRHRQGRPRSSSARPPRPSRRPAPPSLKLKVSRKGKVAVKVTFKPTSGAVTDHAPSTVKIR